MGEGPGVKATGSSDNTKPLNAQTSPIGRMEIAISTLLRVGVIASLLTILLGLGAMFAHHPDYLKSSADLKRLTAPGAAFPHSLAEIAGGLKTYRGQSIVAVGLLMLIATPIFRVAVSILAFALQRDWTYAIITFVVLAVLLFSFFLGKAGS